MADEFKTHKLNTRGFARCEAIGAFFGELLDNVTAQMGGPGGRDRALLVTKLQEACHVAKRGAASLPECQADYAPHHFITDQDETYCNRKVGSGPFTGICGVQSGTTQAHEPCKAGLE